MRPNRYEFTLEIFFGSVLYKKEQFKAGFECIDNGAKYIKGEHYYDVTLRQSDLKQEKVIRDRDKDILSRKIQDAVNKWSVDWNKAFYKESVLDQKERLNKEIDNILQFTLTHDDKVNFQSLKNLQEFEESEIFLQLREQLNSLRYGSEPEIKYPPLSPMQAFKNYSFWEKLTGKAKEQELQFEQQYIKDKKEWDILCIQIEKENARVLELYREENALVDNERKKINNEIEMQRKNHEDAKKRISEKIDRLEKAYLAGEPDSIEECCRIVLNSSNYPALFPKHFELQFFPETSSLVIDYNLPSPDTIPKEKDGKFNRTKNEVIFFYFSEKEFNSRYDTILYSVILRTVHEIIEADIIDAIDYITVNGYVDFLNRATGKKELKCIATLSVSKNQFLNIDLSKVDPIQCFKSLKGISAKELINLTPVAPLISINKFDSRFIQSKEILSEIDSSTNLAIMEWEDFEHLIRELFDKEFSSNGGEVKVTQSSRDGGVDAVAFDPDPIRGGKIVIQAKRYNNVVGVSAVRDLYGTILNEGATKGIIVTTSHYGNDAYEFAKNKPISLINGENLLYLLQKHGYKARIETI